MVEEGPEIQAIEKGKTIVQIFIILVLSTHNKILKNSQNFLIKKIISNDVVV